MSRDPGESPDEDEPGFDEEPRRQPGTVSPDPDEDDLAEDRTTGADGADNDGDVEKSWRVGKTREGTGPQDGTREGTDSPDGAADETELDASSDSEESDRQADETGEHAVEETVEDQKTDPGDDAAGETKEGPKSDEEEGSEDNSEEDPNEGADDDTNEEADDDPNEEADDDPNEEADDDTSEGADESVESTPIERKTGPPEDEEQPLTEHIEEMVKRLAIVLVVAGVVSLLAFPWGDEFILFLWYSVLPEGISQPHVYHPLELIITQLKAASLLGVVIALPVFTYETYAFMRPGLYPHERRYYLAAVPMSLVLAFVGLVFGYFLVLPAVMTYFLHYSEGVVDIAFALGDTFGLMLVLLGFLAVVFQIPLFIMLAIMMGLTTRSWLEDRRLIIWGVFLAIAFLFSPDPTGMAPFLIAATMVGLFESTLLLLRWTGRGNG